jgi:hypothetical protein
VRIAAHFDVISDQNDQMGSGKHYCVCEDSIVWVAKPEYFLMNHRLIKVELICILIMCILFLSAVRAMYESSR